MRAIALLLVLSTALLAAKKADTAKASPAPKAKDMCTPPPSGTAPALPAKLLPGQGNIHFAITTSNPEAQKFFDQGLNQLHSFWAVEAERSFLQAAELDPTAPMPWWGVAMVAAGDYRPRFQLDTADQTFGKARDPRVTGKRAIDAAEKATLLAETAGKATDLEKMYIASIAARRTPKAGADPDDSYIAGLRAILAKYPKEIEAKTFLALHVMRGFDLPSKTPSHPGSMEAAQILRELMVDAPDHPGVHHYVIHGFEGSTFAKDAWHSCKRYAELVPNIPHALHMPGHIYSQTARWQDAVKSFTDASDNELTWIQKDKLYGRGHHGHNVHYLSTSYSFAGNYEEAIKAAKHLLEFKENPREASQIDGFYNVYRQGWFAALRAVVQGQKWDEILAGQTLPAYDKPRERAWYAWARGLAFAAKGDAKSSAGEAKKMDAAMKEFRQKVGRGATEELLTARLELDGHVLAAKGKNKRAITTLERAMDKDRSLDYTEPPYYPRPVALAVAQLALKMNQPDRAKRAYEIALEQFPGNAHSEKGLRALGAVKPASNATE